MLIFKQVNNSIGFNMTIYMLQVKYVFSCFGESGHWRGQSLRAFFSVALHSNLQQYEA